MIDGAKGKAIGRMVRDPLHGKHYAEVDIVHNGQHYTTRVDVLPGESEVVALELAFDDVKRKARAVYMSDLVTGERIR